MIKIVIWDLDDTLWRGNIGEGTENLFADERLQLPERLARWGIINSICSHNNFSLVKAKLEEYGIEAFFVFKIASWDPKGPLVAGILETAGLRPQNALFIDDRASNRAHVASCCPGIAVCDPQSSSFMAQMENLIQQGDEDPHMRRLEQYRLLERKHQAAAQAPSDQQFLKNSHIHVSILPLRVDDIDRVHDLIIRTNQLNFTKRRISKEKLETIAVAGNGFVVRVWDRFGDYGLVGFAACENGKVEHFVFSCRVLNMGIESFVFHRLNMPSFAIAQPVACNIGPAPDWIVEGEPRNMTRSSQEPLLLLGGCDLTAIQPHIGLPAELHFNYTARGNPKHLIHRDSIDFLNPSVLLDNAAVDFILNTCPFVDRAAFEVPDLDKFDRVVYSPMIDYIQGKYASERVPGFYLSCHPFLHQGPLTKARAQRMAEERGISIKAQRQFAAVWHPVAKPDKIWKTQLVGLFAKCRRIVVLLPPSQAPSHLPDAHLAQRHRAFNRVIADVCRSTANTRLVKIDDFIASDQDFTNSIRHFSRRLYAALGKAIAQELQQ